MNKNTLQGQIYHFLCPFLLLVFRWLLVGLPEGSVVRIGSFLLSISFHYGSPCSYRITVTCHLPKCLFMCVEVTHGKFSAKTLGYSIIVCPGCVVQYSSYVAPHRGSVGWAGQGPYDPFTLFTLGLGGESSAALQSCSWTLHDYIITQPGRHHTSLLIQTILMSFVPFADYWSNSGECTRNVSLCVHFVTYKVWGSHQQWRYQCLSSGLQHCVGL
jgi:hypothetical protein